MAWLAVGERMRLYGEDDGKLALAAFAELAAILKG